MNATQRLLKSIQDIFYKKLLAKTGWGRNEIQQLYAESVQEALVAQLNLE